MPLRAYVSTMMRTNICISAVVLLFFKSALSQQFINRERGFELVRVDYTVIPSLGDIQLDRQGVNLNFFKKLNSGGLRLGLAYSRSELTFKDADESHQFGDFDNFHILRFNMSYIRPLAKNWSINISLAPTLSSNFKGALSTEDIIYTAFGTVGKQWITTNKRSSLRFGLAFGTQFGSPLLFPVLSYQKQVNEKLSYAIGLPVTGIFYTINKYNSINFRIRPEGAFVNNSNILRIAGDDRDFANTKLQLNAFSLSLGYDLQLDKHWVTTFSVGYIPTSNIEVLDDNNDVIYDFEADESISINIGLSFNINRTKNNDKNETRSRN